MKKISLNITATVSNLDEIKELLPDIATLQKKYDVVLTISCCSETDLSSLPLQKEDKHS